MKKRFLSMIIAMAVLITLFCSVGNAKEITTYQQIYTDFISSADNDGEHPFNKSSASGMILLDLNNDNIPELLTYNTSDTQYILNSAFSIVDGKVKEDTPWKFEDGVSSVIPVPYMPDEDVTDTEEICAVADYKGEHYLILYDASFFDTASSYFNVVWYDEEGFGFSDEMFDRDFFDTFLNIPSASMDFYYEKTNGRKSYRESAELLFYKYNDALKLPSALNTSEWATDEVQKAYETGIIPEEMLNDDLTENITRAEFAAVAVKLNRILQDAEFNWHGGYIVDVLEHPYEMYISEAYALGITNGTGEKDGGIVFSPDLTITREQLATMLCRVMISKKMSGDFYYFAHPLDVVNLNIIKELADYTEISDYAQKPICYLLENKVIKGIDETHFAPKNTATKEQAIILALRIYEYFNY